MNVSPLLHFFRPVWQLAHRCWDSWDKRHLWEWDWSRWLINLSEKMGGWIFRLPLWWCAIMHADSLEMSHPCWRWSGLEKTSFPGLDWSGAQSRVPLHSHDGLLQAVCGPCCQIQRWARSEVDKLAHYSSWTVQRYDCSFGVMKSCFH